MNMTLDLFADKEPARCEIIAEGAILLRGFSLEAETIILTDIEKTIAQAPLQKMVTPGGLPMSVTTTSCGKFGWVSDNYGYRYSPINISSKQAWPAMPASFLCLARKAAAAAGYEHFSPDSCLINVYQPGAKMSLHQDKNEKDFSQPIVSMSFGLPATFLFGGLLRTDKTSRISLVHGDVVVWGGPARLRFHGVLPIKNDEYPHTNDTQNITVNKNIEPKHSIGARRINLTFRKAF